MYRYQSQTGNKWLFLCEPARVSLPWENCSFESKGDGASLFPPLHAVPGFNPVFMLHFCFLPLRQSCPAIQGDLDLMRLRPPPMLGLQPHTILYYYSWLKIFVTICLNFSSQQGWRAPTLNLIKAFWTSWTIFLSTPEIHSGVTPLSSSRKDIFANGEFKKEVYWFFSYLLPLLLLKLMLAFSEWSITS